VLSLTRGEANGIMYAQFDAGPSYGPLNILESDDVLNSQRDGTNTRLVITLDRNITTGNFLVSILNGAGDPNPRWSASPGLYKHYPR